MTDQSKTLLVVEKHVKLNGDAYRKLTEAGYVIVRGNPADFHVMTGAIGTSTEKLLGEVARTTIACTTWNVVREEYGRNVVRALERIVPLPKPKA